MSCGQIRHVGEVTYAPQSVLRSQPRVEFFVALSGVTAPDLVTAIEVNNAASPQYAPSAGY